MLYFISFYERLMKAFHVLCVTKYICRALVNQLKIQNYEKKTVYDLCGYVPSVWR